MKYLFTALYEDGTHLQQTDEDVSVKDVNRSAFFDVDHDNLALFTLVSAKDSISVDLRTGDFSLNDVKFSAYDEEVKDRRLIYFRRNVIQFDQTTRQELGHIVTFYIGWQGNDLKTDENIQRVLVFS